MIPSQSGHDPLADCTVTAVRHWDERSYINVRCCINVRNHYRLLMGAKLFLSKDPTPRQEVLVEVLTTSVTQQKRMNNPGSTKEPRWDLELDVDQGGSLLTS